MGFVQEVFRSRIFRYAYVFHIGKDMEVYELSENQLSNKELAEKKQIIFDAYEVPVVWVRMERLNQ